MNAAVACVLHGGQQLPAWFDSLSTELSTYVILNDPRHNQYVLPADSVARSNLTRRGFAWNMNRLVDAAFDDGAEVVVAANFDVECDPDSVRRLIELAKAPRARAVSAAMIGEAGDPIFSVGRYPSPLAEFVRSCGLDRPRLRRVRRLLLLHFNKNWRTRNELITKSRQLGSEEYLPWTLIAINRSAWLAAGGLDERFELYAEDVDWGIRGQRAGVSMLLVDVGRVLHRERATASTLADTLYELSHVRLHRKYRRTWNYRAQVAGLRLRYLSDRLSGACSLDWTLLRPELSLGAPSRRSTPARDFSAQGFGE